MTWSNHSDPSTRHMFNTMYFFYDVMIDEMIVRWLMKNFESLNKKELEKVTAIWQNIWNNWITREEKRKFEEIGNQKKLENIYRSILIKIDFDEAYKNPEKLDSDLKIRLAWVNPELKRKMNNYYIVAKWRFQKEAKKLNFNSKYIENIIKRIESGKFWQDIITGILQEATELNMKKKFNTPKWIKELNWIMIELQALNNYSLIEKNWLVTNIQFFGIAEIKSLNNLTFPKDLSNYCELVLDTHFQIDNFINAYNSESLRKHNEFIERLRSFWNDHLDTFSYHEITEEERSILHHFFDWYSGMFPENIHSKSTEKLVVIIYVVLLKILEIVWEDEYYTSRLDKEFLANFWSWKNAWSYGSVCDTAFYNMLYCFEGDLELLIPTSFKLAKNWERKWVERGGSLRGF